MLTKQLSRILKPGLFVCLAVGPAASWADIPVPIERTQIADGVYQFTTAPDGYVPNGNSVVIVNEKDVLVFDTFTRPSSARVELDAIRKITDKPVRYVANSHWHIDHWSGNEVYRRAFPDLEIIATEETRQYMLNTARAWAPLFGRDLPKDQAEVDTEVKTHKTSDGTRLSDADLRKLKDDMQLEREFVSEATKIEHTYPTLTYSEKLTLHHGGREFDFISVTGDARGTSILYLPKEKILITGDAVSFPLPYYTPPLSQHAKTLRALAQLDVDVIIPGHGPAWHDKQFLNLEAELFESVVRQVGEALRNGLVTIEEVQKAVNVSSYRERFTHEDKDLNKQFDSYVDGLVANAYREGRDGQVLKY